MDHYLLAWLLLLLAIPVAGGLTSAILGLIERYVALRQRRLERDRATEQRRRRAEVDRFVAPRLRDWDAVGGRRVPDRETDDWYTILWQMDKVRWR